MLPPAHIPVQPSCQDCLAWSQDGELAVAAGELVYLLLPQYGSSDPWKILSITVSEFTTEEWPRKEQASFQDMSIGEEQARATVTALAWSPPGLAKHGRSVLAVLTSNLILSLWASDSDPTVLGSWERVLVVNKILSSGSRLQQRIRSMAWAPTNHHHGDRLTTFPGRKWKLFLLAIADDSNGLYFVKVSSPFARYSVAWKVEVLHRESVAVSNSPSDRPSLLSLALNANHFIDRIEFGRWDHAIPVTYRTFGIVHHARIVIREDSIPRERSEDFSGSGRLTVSIDEASSWDNNLPTQSVVTTLIKTQMAMEKVKYGVKNNIGSNVALRIWGLASVNDLVAACITIHPAKMAEYIAPFEGESTLIFDAANGGGDAKSVFPWQSSDQIDVVKTQLSILDTIVDYILQRNLASKSLDLKIAYTAFCGTVLSSDDGCIDRLERLQAASDMLDVIERQAGINLLLERQALLSIKTSSQLSKQDLRKTVQQMTIARSQNEPSAGSPEKDFLDLCPFCPESQRAIPFDSFTDAHCCQRHPFARCALTFLPVIQPGITKRCINCKREFFNEHSHTEINVNLPQRLGSSQVSESSGENLAGQEDTGLAKNSLAFELFDKYDTCPYCGSTFCG